MKSMKRGLAVLLAVLLVRPTLPVSAETEAAESQQSEIVSEAVTNAVSECEVPLYSKESTEGNTDVSSEETDKSAAVSDETTSTVQNPEEETGEGNGNASDMEGTDADVSENPEDGSEDSEASKEGENSESDPGEGNSNVSDVPEDSSETEDDSAAGSEEDGSDVPGSTEDSSEAEVNSAAGSEENGSDASESTADSSKAEVDGTVGSETDAGDVSDSDAVSGSEKGELAPEFGDAGVVFSTGSGYQLVVNPSVSKEEAYEGFAGIFEADGSYTIQIPEVDPFFPYEVQFVDLETSEPQNVWFMTPDSVVEFGGHTFRVAANFTGNAVTQLSLNIAGDVVVIYPEEKDFSGTAPMSLLPLEEVSLGWLDLTGYTPLDLTMVSVDSIFAGQVDLKGTDKVIWATTYDDVPDYKVNQSGDYINLSYANSFQLIVGEPDQLKADNIRYIVHIDKTSTPNWLTPSFYAQDENGTRTAVEVKDDDYHTNNSRPYNEKSKYIYGYERIRLSSLNGRVDEGYLALGINKNDYSKSKFETVRAFEGWYESPQEAMAATEVTSQIFATDMTQVNAGYFMERYNDGYITLVAYDAQGNVTGCLPMEMYYYSANQGLEVGSLRDSSGEYVSYSRSYRQQDGCTYYTYQLSKGVSAEERYYVNFTYYNDGEADNSFITAAYVGHYDSIAAAQAAGAQSIKTVLNGYHSCGHGADYSSGVNFTIFIGADGTEGEQVLKYNIKTEASDYERPLSSNANVSFDNYLYGANGYVPAVKLMDSYAENNYVVYVVNDDVDRTYLALDFSVNDNGLKLYAAGSSTPEIPGESFHDFSKGPVQFTASAENGENAKNYWVQIITRSSVDGQLFINSLIDTNANTRTEGGITYTTREVMLDGLHDYQHDILIANMGSTAIPNLSAKLDSNVVELDEYWTLTGNYELKGFDAISQSTSYGKLDNLAAVRLKEKAGVEDGTDITGTLTLMSGETVLMVITLTGTVGDPSITTKEVPEAVKYVPYGTMIQNSNKYSWNTVRYYLDDGQLPEGMVIRRNGELYGVPTEVGEFTFTVRMSSSSGNFKDSYREFTLVVKENTNANVEGQTDENYKLTDRVTYNYNIGLGDQLMVSQGVYGEFVDLWLDGEKLTPGVDYTSESGSTRITIFAQTLTTNKTEGTHTLGAEFRTADNNTLKRAAQNYILGGKSSFEEDNNSNNNNSGNDNNNNNNNNNSSSSSGSSSKGSRDAAIETSSTTYTVQSGDSLWKIAVKFFGDGNQWRKIYEDNKDVLSDPNKIRAGQVLKIIVTTVTGTSDRTAAGVAEDGTYTVQPGDSLWKIAAKVYGNGRRWNKIYEANSDKISDASKIRVGQVLVIPE